MTRPIAVLVLLGHLLPALSWGNWPDFRGPTLDGHAPAEVVGLPVEWSEDKNVAWKTAIHGRAWSSPVVWGDRIFLTTADPEGYDQFVFSIDRGTGRILHEERIFHNEYPHPLGNEVNTYASPSPVVEEGRVYFHFGRYGTACKDAETFETLWSRRDIECDHYRGPGSSPVLFENLLILTMDGIDEQYLIALDKRTGETVWRIDRATEWNDLDANGLPAAGGDFRKAYNTPYFYQENGEPRMISFGAKATYCYDPRDGSEIWRVRYGGFSNASRAVIGGGLVFLNTGYGKADLLAVELGGRGDITDTHVRYTLRRAIPKRSAPVIVGDELYMVDDGGVASCIDVATGNEHWRERLGEEHSACPVYADGRIYFFGEEGGATVIRPGRTFDRIAASRLESGFMACPAVAGREFYLRTKTHLYRIEEMGR